MLPKGSGMVAFVVKGGDAAALRFMRKLNIIYEATSLGGIESLIECPFNSSHGAVPEDVRMEAGIVPGLCAVDRHRRRGGLVGGHRASFDA